MAGYSRQSIADIIAGATVRAAPINAEYNALRDAFAFATGHTHDGSSNEGAFVPLIADTDGNNKVVVDTSNNRVSFYTEVGGSAVEQIRVQDGAIVPVTDDDIDLGASGAEFKNLFIDGTANIDALVSAAVTITGGNIDGTVIGASTPAAGTFAGLTVDSGAATLGTNVDINGGTVDGASIGSNSPSTIVGTTITANTGFTGDVTGDVTGNLTGNVTGNVTGDVTGNLTGNVTAGTGLSTFNNVTVNGTLDVTGTTIANVTDPVNPQDAATKNYVDTEVANLVDSAPGTLDTLNELAAALGDDANFSTTIATQLGDKIGQDGSIAMEANLDLGTNKIVNVVDPTSNQDAATKKYVDDQDNLQLSLTGGTMTGNIVMGSNKVTSTATPSTDDDLTRKAYVDSILGSATSAATSAGEAADSASDAEKLAINPEDSQFTLADGVTTGFSALHHKEKALDAQTAAEAAQSAAENALDSFDDRYLGVKSSDPTLDNDGDALLTGALYFNDTIDELLVYDGSNWTSIGNTAVQQAQALVDSFEAVYLGAQASQPTVDLNGDPVDTGDLYFDTTADEFRVYNGNSWVAAGSAVNGTSARETYTATASQTTFAVVYDVGSPSFVDVYLNGVKLIQGTDFTATSGTNIVLTTGATAGDIVDIIAFGAFEVANTYTKAEADSKFSPIDEPIALAIALG